MCVSLDGCFEEVVRGIVLAEWRMKWIDSMMSRTYGI